jgi:lipopolysaccharide/colanic/teichoic acid biosynthesis glycosyltransferase
MKPTRASATTLLFLGDAVVLAASLWLTLMLRYGGSAPDARLEEHFLAFAPLFLLWLLIFYMAGLYGKRIILFKVSVFRAILQTQVLNIILAALYFFLMPGIGLAPKTNLVLYLLISLALILTWRFVVFPRLSRPVSREPVALVGTGPEFDELLKEVNGNDRYPFRFTVTAAQHELLDSMHQFMTRLEEEGIGTLVLDTHYNATLKSSYARITILDIEDVYEEIFDRVPLTLVEREWFALYASSSSDLFYAFAKRSIDIVGGLMMGAVTLAALPFVALLMRLEGKGPVFIRQERYGKDAKIIRSYKFRSMRFSDNGAWKGEGENRVTKVGGFLRRTSLDEFPQFVNVLKGELSLIGPRNDIKALGERLAEALPHYLMRYRVTPGITGWAQINQQYEPGNISPQSIEETKVRLAYDFYYLKHRSLTLDIVIALKTVKRMLFRVSSW